MKSYSISQRNKSRGSKIWYGRTFENGVLIKEESLKTESKAIAKQWLDVMNAMRFTPASLMGIESNDPSMPIEKCMNSFLDNYEGSTMRSYKGIMKMLSRFSEDRGIRNIGDWKTEHADGYMKSLDMEDSSRKQHYRIAKLFFSWSISTYSLSMMNPFDKIKPPKVSVHEKKFLTEDVIDKMLDAAPTPKFRLFWALMAFAGMRHSEAVHFGPSYIDGDTLHFVGKGDKDARVPISERLKEEMSRIEITDRMFDVNRMRRNYESNEVIRATLESIGISSEGISNHTLRHSFASNLARAGVQEKLIQKLARHSNIATTMQVYTHVLDDDLFKAVNTKKEGV